METDNTTDHSSNSHQPDWEQSLHRLNGLDVVVQLLGATHWVAKTSRPPICLAHGATMFDAITNLDRVVIAMKMGEGESEKGSE